MSAAGVISVTEAKPGPYSGGQCPCKDFPRKSSSSGCLGQLSIAPATQRAREKAVIILGTLHSEFRFHT